MGTTQPLTCKSLFNGQLARRLGFFVLGVGTNWRAIALSHAGGSSPCHSNRSVALSFRTSIGGLAELSPIVGGSNRSLSGISKPFAMRHKESSRGSAWSRRIRLRVDLGIPVTCANSSTVRKPASAMAVAMRLPSPGMGGGSSIHATLGGTKYLAFHRRD